MKKEKQKPLVRKTHQLDASGESLGRLATKIAHILRGKNKATYVPYKDEGDIVLVSHIDQVKITGNKMTQKVYHAYSGYPGGMKTRKMADIFAKDPADVLRRAVLQMLPPTRLRKGMMKRLHIQFEERNAKATPHSKST